MLSYTACPDNSGKSRLDGKTFIQILFFFLIVTQICFAQWYHQNSGTYISLKGVYFFDNYNGWISGDSGIILNTTDGGLNWFPQSSGTNQNLYGVYFVDSINGWIVGEGGTILKTANGGTDWINQISGTNYALADLYFYDKHTGWASGGSYQDYISVILKTIDGGINWIPQVNVSGPYLYDLFFLDSTTGWAVGDYKKILKTTDGGRNWVSQYEDIWQPGFLCIYFNDYNKGWVVGWNGAMMKTTNGGTTWFNYPSGTGELLNDIYFTDSMNGWIVGGNSFLGLILHTTDGGINWFYQSIPTAYLFDTVVFPDDNNGWTTGLYGIILHTTNGGVSFVEEEQIDEMPTEFLLSNNYPNPFNPSTKIKYSVPQSSNVVIKVFDILGNEIETLVKEEKTAGTYEVTWYGANLPSGVYFYQLRAVDPSTGSGQSFIRDKEDGVNEIIFSLW